MKKLLLVSRVLTKEGIQEKKNKLSVQEAICLPTKLQEKWDSKENNEKEVSYIADTIIRWVLEIGYREDYVFVQNDSEYARKVIDYLEKEKYQVIY